MVASVYKETLIIEVSPADAKDFLTPGASFTIDTGDEMRYLGCRVIRIETLPGGQVRFAFTFLMKELLL